VLDDHGEAWYEVWYVPRENWKPCLARSRSS
jgi:hypothetical protein